MITQELMIGGKKYFHLMGLFVEISKIWRINEHWWKEKLHYSNGQFEHILLVVIVLLQVDRVIPTTSLVTTLLTCELIGLLSGVSKVRLAIFQTR